MRFPTCCLILAAALAGGSAGAAGLPARPNILFLLTDDQRWDAVAALGNPDIRTPNFDRLVRTGYHFSNAYCMGSMIGAVCLPSRTMIATGRSLWRIPENPRQRETPAGVFTLPGLLNAAGYATMHAGKSGNACTFSNETFQVRYSHGRRDANSATEYADAVIDFLRQHDGAKPFFVYLAPPVPHDPRVAPPQYHAMYDPAKLRLPRQFMPTHPFDPGVLDIRDEKLAAYPRTEPEMRRHLADYYATTTHLDHEFGRVLDVVRERGWFENTIILFSSDQGLAVGGFHALMGKQNFYEDVKPPLVLAGPGIPHGESPALVYLFDLFPTILELAGVPVPAVTEGRSLLPIVAGRQTKLRDTLIGAYANLHRMIRDERWKLYKFNVRGEKHARLFDLQNDAEELRDLAGDPAHAATLARLERLLSEARRDLGDPVDFDSADPQVPAWARPAAGKAGKNAKKATGK
jgi:arylsulfatase A-like enzyme